MVRHAVDGDLESEEVAAFFGELVSQLVSVVGQAHGSSLASRLQRVNLI